MIKLRKFEKGEYGYMEEQRIWTIVKTILLFLIAISIFIAGYILTKTRANILTILAVLLLLPASKSTVLLIMYLKVPKYSKEVYESINSVSKDYKVIYQLYLTSYQKNYPLSCVTAGSNSLIGYTEFPNCEVSKCEEHINDIFKQNGITNYTIKIFLDKEKYIDRLKHISEGKQNKTDEQCMALVTDISL